MFARKRILFILLVLNSFHLQSQDFMVLNQWRLYRHELALNIGASNFLGDLGGRDQIGTDFIYDLETKLTRPTVGIDYRYYLSRGVVWRNSLLWAQIGGDDALTQEPFRHNRNLSFQSNNFELSTLFEFQFIKEKDHRRHNLKNVKGKRIGWLYKTWGFYAFGGVGVTYFEPTAMYEGKRYKLRKLHTEGQGLSGGPKAYEPFTIVIPIGAGFKYVMNEQWALTLELSHRFTFTDYMDDVSGNYYDPVSIGSAYGPAAAALSNPTNNSIPFSQLGYDPTSHGFQRGDPTDKDAYLLLTIGVHFRFRNDYHRPYGSVKYNKKRRAGKRKF